MAQTLSLPDWLADGHVPCSISCQPMSSDAFRIVVMASGFKMWSVVLPMDDHEQIDTCLGLALDAMRQRAIQRLARTG